MVYKQILFVENIAKNKDNLKLAKLYETINAYCYLDECDVEFKKEWESFNGEIFKKILKVDCGEYKDIWKINEFFTKIKLLMEKYKNKLNRDNHVINAINNILDEI